jgi:hypothetical protein
VRTRPSRGRGDSWHLRRLRHSQVNQGCFRSELMNFEVQHWTDKWICILCWNSSFWVTHLRHPNLIPLLPYIFPFFFVTSFLISALFVSFNCPRNPLLPSVRNWLFNVQLPKSSVNLKM